MTCMDAQALIISFINDELSINDTQEFLLHIKSCSECYEELVVYYTLITAMLQLDKQKNISNNYEKELNSKINITEEKIIKLKIAKIRKNLVFYVIIILISIIVSFKNGIIAKEKKGFHPNEKSNYKLLINYKSNSYKKHEIEYNNYLNIIYEKEEVSKWKKS